MAMRFRFRSDWRARLKKKIIKNFLISIIAHCCSKNCANYILVVTARPPIDFNPYCFNSNDPSVQA